MRTPPLVGLALSLALTLAWGPGASAAPHTSRAAARTPAAKAVRTYTIEDFLGTTSMYGAWFSHDGSRILVSSDASGVVNAYSIRIPPDGRRAADLSRPEALTRSTTSAVGALAYFPHDDRFLYSSDQGGNELNHIYVQGPDGVATDLTPGEGLKAMFAGWAPDDRSFFVRTNERDKRFVDLYEVSANDFARSMLYRDSTGYEIGAISADRRLLALVKPDTDHNTDVYLFDRDAGRLTHLTPHSGDVLWDALDFSPDGKYLYATTDEGHEFQYLVRLDVASGNRSVVVKRDWDVLSAALSRSGRYLAVTVNNDARSEVRLYEAATLKEVSLPHIQDGDVTSLRFSRDETRLAFYVNSSRSPSDLWIYDLGRRSLQRLTQNVGRVRSDDLVDGEVVRYPSVDGVTIPALLYRPPGAGRGTKAPALVWVHGGPGGQTRLVYSGFIQYLVNHGYAVLAVNNRGSSGYGKTFYSLDDRRHGDADLDDCVAAKAYLAGTGLVDTARVAIVGGSYGGYMVLAALAFRPTAFAAGVDLFGVANWVRTLKSIPSWWESQRRAIYRELGDPRTDEAYLRRISPLFHADRITRPLLVLQGANDPRVLKVESDEIVAAVKAKGVPVEYIVFDNEGHGFRRKDNQARGYRAVLEFCDRYLKSQETGAVH